MTSTGERLLRGQPAVLVAALVAAYPNPVSVASLIDVVWSEKPPPSAAVGLRAIVSRVRSLLRGPEESDPIEHVGDSYRLSLPPGAIDATGFAEYVQGARRDLEGANVGDALQQCEDALALWRGEPFAGLPTIGWLQTESSRLELLHLEAQDMKVEALLALDQPEAAAAFAALLADAEPLREQRWARLMVALYRSGRQAEALRAYQSARRILADELGLDPSAELRSLEQAVIAQDSSLDARPARATGVGRFVNALRTTTRGSLPTPSSSLIGRRAELADVVALLSRHRIVSLVGPGGVGKTRLALEAATVVEGQDVAFVLLANHVKDTVALALATQLRVKRRPDEDLIETLVEQLRTSAALVVLDNCEHVIEAAAQLAHALVTGCPRVTVLATSRVPLDCEGEARLLVGPLPSVDARALLVSRAAAVGASLDEVVDHDVVDRLVRRVDCLPLAIELAAGQLDTISAEDLDALLADSLGVLRASNRSDERHRDMTTALAWSYELLRADAAGLFDVLGAMPGPFFVEDAAAIGRCPVPDAARRLRDLARASLIVVDHSQRETRFRLLEPVRLFVRERSRARDADLSRRHLEHFRAVASEGSVALRGDGELPAVDRLETSIEQLRAAFRCAIEIGDVDTGAHLAVELWDFGLMRLHYDILDWAEAIAALPDAADHPLYPELLGSVGLGAWARSDPERARAFGEAGLRAATRLHTAPPIPAHHALMNVAGYEGNQRESVGHLDIITTWSLELNDPYWLTSSHVIATIGSALSGDPETAAACAAAASAVADRSENPSTLGWAAYATGLASLDAAVTAIGSFERGATLARSVRNGWVLGMNLSGLVTALRKVGREDDALTVLQELLVLWHRGLNRAQLGHALTEAALLLAARHAAAAAAALAAADAIPLSFPPLPSDRDAVDSVRTRLSERVEGALARREPLSDVIAHVRACH